MFISPDTEGLDTPEWLQVIHEVNEIKPGTFLEPERQGEQWDGSYVEEYATAWVVFQPEHTRFQSDSIVRVVGKNFATNNLIARAAKNLNLTSKEEAA